MHTMRMVLVLSLIIVSIGIFDFERNVESETARNDDVILVLSLYSILSVRIAVVGKSVYLSLYVLGK